MKPTSIVSLIIAVLLIILGLVTCMIAQNMANANGELLFSETREDGLVNTVDLTESEISKIELLVTDAEINIIGKGDKACIEFVNFRENYYNLSVANRVLSFSEIPDVMSMLKFWENGFTFKGMRYILNYAKDQEQTTDVKKIINLYLPNDKAIKIFEIGADTCTLSIEGMSSGTDYNLTVENAEININGLKTTSNFNINSRESDKPAQSVKLSMNTALMANMNINAQDLTVNANVYRCSGETKIDCMTGSIDLKTVKQPEVMKLDLESISGAVYINGMEADNPLAQNTPNADDPKITITSDSADIRISHTGTITEDPAQPENPDDLGG